jgi:hypothetical protein
MAREVRLGNQLFRHKKNKKFSKDTGPPLFARCDLRGHPTSVVSGPAAPFAAEGHSPLWGGAGNHWGVFWVILRRGVSLKNGGKAILPGPARNYLQQNA